MVYFGSMLFQGWSTENQSSVGWTGIIECGSRHLSERLYCFRHIIATDQILHLVNDLPSRFSERQGDFSGLARLFSE